MLKAVVVAVMAVSLMALGGCDSPGPRYKDVGSYSEGMAAVKSANGKWGFINRNQVMVIPPKFDEVKEFKDGKAAAKMNGRWGFINKQGQWK